MLRWALNQDPPLVERHGAGKKGDPYRYFLPPVPPVHTREGEKHENKSVVSLDDFRKNSPSRAIQASTVGGSEKVLTGLASECSTNRFQAWDEAIDELATKAAVYLTIGGGGKQFKG